MRRLILFLMVVGCFGQDLNYTKDELNGLAWGKMTSPEKIMLLSGVQVGNSVVVAWALSDLPTCSERVASTKFPKVSAGDMAKDVDRFTVVWPMYHCQSV